MPNTNIVCAPQSWCPVPSGSGSCLPAPVIDGVMPWMSSVGCRDWMKDEWCPMFKDVPFAVEMDVKSGGRRIHIHEYPSREWWDNEDMGRLRQMMDVTAFVFGDRCDEWAEILFAACTDASIGKLYLPDRPPVDARCLSVESTTNQDKGVIHFQLRFVLETGEPIGLVPSRLKSATQSRSLVDTTAQVATNASRALFETSFTGNQNQMARNQASDMMLKVVKQTRKTQAQARIAPTQATQINFNLQRMSDMAVEITDLQKSIPDVLTPQYYTKTQKKPDIIEVPQEGFGALLEENMNLLASGATSYEDLRQALLPMTTVHTKDLAISTQSVRDFSTTEELALAEDIAALTRRLSLALTCRAITRAGIQYLPDATKIRKTLLGRLDDEAFLASSDDPTFKALRMLKTAITDFIANFAAGGQTVKRYKFNSLMPVAVYAANIYPTESGDKDRDIQLVKLNDIDHPMFPQSSKIDAYLA